MPPKKDKKEKKAKDDGGDRPATGEGGDGASVMATCADGASDTAPALRCPALRNACVNSFRPTGVIVRRRRDAATDSAEGWPPGGTDTDTVTDVWARSRGGGVEALNGVEAEAEAEALGAWASAWVRRRRPQSGPGMSTGAIDGAGGVDSAIDGAGGVDSAG